MLLSPPSITRSLLCGIDLVFVDSDPAGLQLQAEECTVVSLAYIGQEIKGENCAFITKTVWLFK